MMAMRDEATSELQIQTLLALRRLADELATIDPNAADGDELAARTLTGELQRLSRRTLELLDVFRRDETSSPSLDAIDQDAWQTTSNVEPGIADMAFAVTIELRSVQRELGRASSVVERFIAIEAARRKLRRAIRVTLETARTIGIADVLGGEHRGHHHVADVASGLAVRKLYAEFRRALRSPTGKTNDEVMAAMRYAVGALAVLVSNPDYADVRANDRTALRSLRERALRWAREDRTTGTGLQILADVTACAELMRGINLRQELRAHDASLIASLRTESLSPVEWHARCAALFGLDDQLDEDLVNAGEPSAETVARAMRHLERLS